MKFSKTFISDVFENSQPISRKSSPKSPGGRFLNHSTVFAAEWSSNGGLEAVVSKSLAQGHKGLTTHRCSFYFAVHLCTVLW